VIHGTVDIGPPDGLAELFRIHPRIWIIRKGAGLPETPRWAREYAIWLQKFAVLVREKRLVAGFRGNGMKFNNNSLNTTEEDDDIYLQLYEMRGLY
jgi:hypothetical protein